MNGSDIVKPIYDVVSYQSLAAKSNWVNCCKDFDDIKHQIIFQSIDVMLWNLWSAPWILSTVILEFACVNREEKEN